MASRIEGSGASQRLVIDYNPGPVSKQFIEDGTFCCGLYGPLGTGKSTAGVIKAWLYAQQNPGARIAIIRDTYPALLDTTVVTFLDWLPDGIAGTYAKQRKIFYLNTSNPRKPAEILFRAGDDKDDINNVLSLDLAAAFFDEPQGGLALKSERTTREPGIDQELFRMVLSRVGRQKGFKPLAWMTGNPPSPSHWIAKAFGYNGKGQPANPFEDFKLYLAEQSENAHNLTPGYYDRLHRLFGYGTPLARRFIDGEWIEYSDLQPFNASWINYYDHIPSEGMVVKIGVDPAISDDPRSSRSAFVAVGQCRGSDLRGHMLVLAADAGHWSAYEQADRILKMAKLYNARSVVIEDVAFQRSLKEIVEREMRARGMMLSVELSKPDADKLRRANAWSPFVEDGTILFAPNQKDLIDCMLSVPNSKGAWDLVDACGLAVRSFVPMQGESERIGIDPAKAPANRAAGYATDLHKEVMKPKPTRLRNPFIKHRAEGYGVGRKLFGR
jgi:predicted phage terminase large subunit-like protein